MEFGQLRELAAAVISIKPEEELETVWADILFFKSKVGRNKNTSLICQSCLDTEGQLVSFFCISLSPYTFILA